MSAPKNNTNAAKPAKEKLGWQLLVRCTRDELIDWKREARHARNDAGKRLKLSEWIRRSLNESAHAGRVHRNLAKNLNAIRDQLTKAHEVYECADCGREFASGEARDNHFMSSDCPKYGK